LIPSPGLAPAFRARGRTPRLPEFEVGGAAVGTPGERAEVEQNEHALALIPESIVHSIRWLATIDDAMALV
jgi:hypothetical protein